MTLTPAAPSRRSEARDDDPLLKFVADDVTGATDVLDTLLRRGYSAAVHMAPPIAGDPTLDGVQVVGVASTVRSWTDDRARRDLPALFAAVAALPGDLVHFKVCSTFDSSPQPEATTGSRSTPVEPQLDPGPSRSSRPHRTWVATSRSGTCSRPAATLRACTGSTDTRS